MATKTIRKPARNQQTDEQRAEVRKAKVDVFKAELDVAVAGLGNETQWVDYLDLVSQFGTRYSWSNQLMILVQCQVRGFSPQLVMSYNAWKAKNRHVIAGEKGLAVWAPVKRRLRPDEIDKREKDGKTKIARTEKGWSVQQFLFGWKIEYVFDISQTDGEPVELPKPLEVRRRVQTNGPIAQLLEGEDSTGALADVIALIEAEGFSYARGGELPGSNGTTYYDSRRVCVRIDVSDAQAAKTSIHELAHIRCGHESQPGETHRGRKETEAESVAYIVCKALGLDTTAYSAPYVNSWSQGDGKVIAAAAETVVKVAQSILRDLEPAEAEEVTDVA